MDNYFIDLCVINDIFSLVKEDFAGSPFFKELKEYLPPLYLTLKKEDFSHGSPSIGCTSYLTAVNRINKNGIRIDPFGADCKHFAFEYMVIKIQGDDCLLKLSGLRGLP